MKRDAPFYVGSTNLFDYQAPTGAKRWNTLRATVVTGEPTTEQMLKHRAELAEQRRFTGQPITGFGQM